MENNKKKKKSVWNRVKRIFKMVVKEIGEFFKNIYKKFMSLSKSIRYVIGVWVIILVLLLVLIVGSNKNAEFLKEYAIMEDEMNLSALDYVESNELYPTKENKLILDMELLRDLSYLYDDYVVDDNCAGFSVVYHNGDTEKYVINSYVNCEHYTTKGYSDYK